MIKDIIFKLNEIDGITTEVHKNPQGLEFLLIFHRENIIAIGSVNQGEPKYPLSMFPHGQNDMWKIPTLLPKNLILYIAIYERRILSNGPICNIESPPNCIEIDLKTLSILIQLLSFPEYPNYSIDNLTYTCYYGQRLFGFLSENPNFLKNQKGYTS